MRKLISILVAAMFVMSSGFAVAADTGAKPMEKKEEMKKGDKKPAKKAAKKAKAAKKDEMKK